MRYALLIYSDESRWATLTAGDFARAAAAHGEYAEQLRAAGKLVHGDPLQPSASARTVHFDGGDPIVTDGPFAETKEVLGGFYLIEADSDDEAIAWARRMPVEPGVKVEIRPIATMPGSAS